MEIKFTLSILETINMVMRIGRGTYTYIPELAGPTGRETWPELDAQRRRAPRPDWCMVDFEFSRIKATPIQRGERFQPIGDKPGLWTLSRKVEFYKHGKLVARLHMTGSRCDGSEHKDNDASWAVDEIGYYRVSGMPLEAPSDWIEIRPMVFGLTSRLVEPTKRHLSAA